MSTRGAIAIVKNSRMITLYNHFDSYPEVLGMKLVEFLSDKSNILSLKEYFNNIVEITTQDFNERIYCAAGGKEKYDQLNMAAKSALSNAVWEGYNGVDGDDFEKLLPALKSGSKVNVYVHPSFPGDSLICEYAYVIDLDSDIFELYVGFNKVPVEGERFSCFNGLETEYDEDTETMEHKKYYPVRFSASWSFDNLPDEKKMVEAARKTSDIIEKESNKILYPSYPLTIDIFINGEKKDSVEVETPYDMKVKVNELISSTRNSNNAISVKIGNEEIFKFDISNYKK